MHISKIKYGKSFQITEGLWEKIGVEIDLDKGESVEKARTVAKELVEEIYTKNNPGLPISAFQPNPLPILGGDPLVFDDEINDEYKYVEQQISACEDKQSAESVLMASAFKYNIQLKKIVNSKPDKKS